MSYVTYTTQALVCGTYNRSAADRSFALYTREAGMLYAEAKSVREERSRQRYALQDFSLIRVSLVKGKQTWKVGSVEVITNYFMSAADRAKRASVVRLFRNLRRFIQGEEPSPELFDFVVSALSAIEGQVNHPEFLELYTELKVLNLLGYVRSDSIPVALREVRLTEVGERYESEYLIVLNRLIAEGIENSHL
jgi:DNA repair protein RecO